MTIPNTTGWHAWQTDPENRRHSRRGPAGLATGDGQRWHHGSGRQHQLDTRHADTVNDDFDRPAWNLLTGTVAKYILLFVNIGLGIFLMPFTMHHLGKAGIRSVDAGGIDDRLPPAPRSRYGNGLVRQITQADARRDDDEVNVILSTFLSSTARSASSLAWRGRNHRRRGGSTVSAPVDVRCSHRSMGRGHPGSRAALAFPMSLYGAVTTARQRFALTGWIAVAVALLQARSNVCRADLRLRAGRPS